MTEAEDACSDVARWWALSRANRHARAHTHTRLSISWLWDTLLVGVTTAAGGICGHGLYIIFILLVVTRRLQAKVIAVVRGQHPHWDIRRLPRVMRRQDVWGDTREKWLFCETPNTDWHYLSQPLSQLPYIVSESWYFLPSFLCYRAWCRCSLNGNK